jgi:hypothetical protein
VKPGLVIGHPVEFIHELASGSRTTPPVNAFGCCHHSMRTVQLLLERQLIAARIGEWRFGTPSTARTREYLLVPNAQANLAKIPTT